MQPFKAAMHDLVNSYRNRAATTEDFKAVMEQNMPPWLDVEGNHRLDWFFNAYVYGTEIPRYSITSNIEQKGDETFVHFKLTQSGVSDDFTMLVPLYLDYGNDNVKLAGRAMVRGSHELEQTMSLGKLQTPPRRMLVNYNYDILSAN